MSDGEQAYVVVGSKPWNRRIFETTIQHYLGKWYFIDSASALTHPSLIELSPRYIFFLHWSLKVPDDILEAFECIVFHMTDVPFGRGGSPLQNLIMRGHRETKLTALRMTSEFDAGPVYVKEPLSLEGSSAEEIYIRACELSAQMIKTIIMNQPDPQPQTGDPTNFKRRKPNESMMPELPDLKALHDFIRMLDADGYPNAYIEYNGYRFIFSRAALYDNRIMADVTISPIEKRNK